MLKKINLKRPILNKLLAILFVAMFAQFTLSLVFNIFGYYLDITDSIKTTINNKLNKLSTDVERILSLGVPLTEIPQFNQELEKEKKEDFISFIAIVDNKGTIIYHSDPINCGAKFPVSVQELEKETSSHFTAIPYNHVHIASKTLIGPKASKEAFVVVGYQSSYVTTKVFMVFIRMVLSSFFSGTFGILLILFFYRKNIEKPLSKLLETVEKIKDGLWEEIEIKSKEPENELEKIATAINKMIRELNNVFSEKEELLEKLKVEEEKLRNIIEKTEIGIAVIKEDKIIFANPGFYKIFNLDPESTIVSTSIFNFFSPFEHPFFRDVFKNVLEHGERQFFDTVRLLDTNKNEIYCTLEISLIGSSEWGSQLLSLTFQDITEKVRFTNELQLKNKEFEELIEKYQSSQLALQIANEKLESALLSVEKANEELKKIDNIKDVFFSTITHELKTPISLIQGYISMLKNDAAIKASPVSADIISAIERASKRLVNLTEEIMELLRIKSGKLTLNLNLTYLGLILKPVIAELEPLLSKKQMTVELENIDNLPILSIDTKKFETVLRNILVNAIKFSKIGGKIYINATVLEEEGKKYLRLSIKDEGCGISKNNIDKVFSEFFTMAPPANIAKELQIKGSGLGLSIAKGIVEAHNGKIWVESEGYDEERFPGTTFYIQLPVNM